MNNADSQTTLVTEEATAQTILDTEEATAQTTSSYFDVQHFGSQISLPPSKVETFDQSEQAAIKASLNDVGVQTGVLARVEHILSRKLAKTKELESKDSFILTKRKSLRKINTSNAMALSDDEGNSR